MTNVITILRITLKQFSLTPSTRFGASLRYIELPIELITHTVLHELANKCPNLTHMLLDFSTAMQLHDFSEMQAFPTKLKYMCICLSEVIFMEGFMRKIYNFINGLEILHLIGSCLFTLEIQANILTYTTCLNEKLTARMILQERTRRWKKRRRKFTK